MQITIYKCDFCRKTLSDGEVSHRHLSFNFSGTQNGWVRRTKERNWKYIATIPKGGCYQFCSYECFVKYFKELESQYKLKKLKE